MSDQTRVQLARTESVSHLSSREAATSYRSPVFAAVATMVQLVAVPLAVLFTDDAAPLKDKIAAPVLTGAIALAATFLAVITVCVVTSPVRQRNELRRGWPD